MAERTDIRASDVFISWTGKDREIKNRIADYLANNGISCLESDHDCCGDFAEWSREAVSVCNVCILVLTENTFESTYVPIEIEEFKKLDNWQNRIIPVCPDISVYQKENWGLHESVSAVFTDGDYLPSLLAKTASLIINRQHAIYQSNCRKEYVNLVPLITSVKASTRQYSFDDLYVTRSVTEIHENNEPGQTVASPKELISEDGVLFISGPAGSGKTQYIHQIRECADTDSLVISLSCAKASASQSSLINLMYDKFARVIGLGCFYTIESFKRLLETKRLILILDGMDEIATKAATDKFVKKINSFYSSNSKNLTVIFTSRNPEDADTIALGGKSPRRFILNRLTDGQIATLGKNLFLLFGSAERNNEFYVNISDLDSEIKGNPLLLSQLAIVYEKTGEIPASIVGIYDAISKITFSIDERTDFDAIPDEYRSMLKSELGEILKSFSQERYILLSAGKKIEAVKILSKLLKERYGSESRARAEFLIEYLENRSILIDGEFYHKMFLEYFTAVAYYEQIFDDYDELYSTDVLNDLFSHYDDSYWSSVINLFLVKADSCIDGDATEELYAKIVDGKGICEYTLLFNTCRDLIRHKESAELVLVLDILAKSADGVYPPYGPLFWYVPEYKLYETAVLAASKMKGNPRALALVRDVCFTCGNLYTLADVTDKVSAEELYLASQSSLSGVRAELVELFCLGKTDSYVGKDVYPRCFNTAESESFMKNGHGVFDTMGTLFADELGLWQSEEYPTLNGEYIGFICATYYKEIIEKKLSKMPTAKVSGLLLTNTNDTAMEFIQFERTSVRVIYIPENTEIIEKDFDKFTKNSFYVRIAEKSIGSTCHVYIPNDVRSITVPHGITELHGEFFRGLDALESAYLPDGMLSIATSAFRYCRSLASISIPDSVVKISGCAFEGCTALSEITIPCSVRKIGWCAFKSCTALTNISIPESVTEIEPGAFEGCSSLKSITIPNSVTEIGSNVFADCTSLQSIKIPNSLTEIQFGLFHNCRSLSEVVIPESVEKIDNMAFINCTALTNLTIPRSVKEIGEWAFKGTGIQNITLPDSVETIGDYAFSECTDLRNITIPDSVKKIGCSAFSDCTKLTDITIPLTVTEIGDTAFYNCENLNKIQVLSSSRRVINKLKPYSEIAIGKDGKALIFTSNENEIFIDDGRTEISDWEFAYSEAEKIHLPSSLKKIGKSAFLGCENLKEIIIPDSVSEIGDEAFKFCVILQSITISDSVKEIGNGVFFGCAQLSHLILPDSLEKIGERAFFGCSSLSDFTIPDSVEKIDTGAFYGCSSLCEINIPGNVKKIGFGAFEDCTGLKTIKISPSVEEIDGMAFTGCTGISDIIIPDSVKLIGVFAFSKCTGLTRISIPKSVETIAFGAFSDCTGLTDISIPDSIAAIETGMFEGCTNLSNITIPSSVTEIESNAFAGCATLCDITIPNSVRKIGDEAFSGCTSIGILEIPINLIDIGDNAFAGCIGLDSVKISANFKNDISRIFGEIDIKKVKFY